MRRRNMLTNDRISSRMPAALRKTRPVEVVVPGAVADATGAAAGLVGERRVARERRGHTLWSFLYGGFRPRRRVGRRRGDLHQTFLDWHEPGVLYLALAILLMSCADALFTLNLLAVGGEELNQVMRLLLGQGTQWFLWAKIGMTGAGIIVLVTAARRVVLGGIPVLWLIWLCFAGYAVLIAWEIYLLGWHATSLGDQALDDLSRWVAG